MFLFYHLDIYLDIRQKIHNVDICSIKFTLINQLKATTTEIEKKYTNIF
jgi:hypothetical protein